MSRHAQLRAAFDQVIDLAQAERASWLAQLSERDPSLAAELQALLELEERGEQFQTQKPSGLIEQSMVELDQRYWQGKNIGRYQILERIGSGGMGQVFLCQRQESELDQRFAIKLLRRDALTPSLLQRFEQERQVLASLQHAHIASLIDAGVDSAGLPFFVMEYVQGTDILSYCQAQKLGISERIALFRQVLSAVAHAHLNFVIHRDLKPSNVLVNAQGQVKLLDFGIAKMLHDPSQTQTAERAFTLAYAAPEQITGSPIGVGCDVYSLGVMLYELLTLNSLFATDGFTMGDLEAQILRQPPKPMVVRYRDTRQSGRHFALSPRAARRWSQTLKGELESIVQKALRKEPPSRYHSVEAFDRDLEAYLAGQPVHASRGGRFYRTKKLIARNPWASLASAALLLGTLLAFVLIWQQRALALKQRDRAESALQILQDAFIDADPAQVDPAQSSARKILERSTQRIAELADKQPENFIALGNKLAEVNLALGLYTEALALAETVASVAGKIDDHPVQTQALSTQVLALVNMSNYLEAQKRLDRLPAEARSSPLMRITQGRIYVYSARPKDGVRLLEQGLAALDGGAGDVVRVQAIWQLANALRMADQPEQAERVLAQLTQDLNLVLGKAHPLTLRSRQFQFDQLRRMNKSTPEALAQGRQLLVDIQAQYGPLSGVAGTAHASLASALIAQKSYAESIPHLEQALAAFIESSGKSSPSSFRMRFNLAQVHATTKANSAADANYRAAISEAEAALVPNYPLIHYFRASFANFQFERDQADAALKTMTETLSGAGVAAMDEATREDYSKNVLQYFDAAACTLSKSTATTSLERLRAQCQAPEQTKPLCAQALRRYCDSDAASTQPEPVAANQ